MSGTITLGAVAAHLTMLEVSCNRCDRRGRLRIEDLIADHGAALPVPKLRRIVAGDCRKMIEGKIHDACGVHFPELSTVFR